METALITLLNKDFEIAFYVMLKSLMDNNPNFNHNIIIMHGSPLSEDFESKAKTMYSNIELRQIETKKYEVIQIGNTPNQYRENYYKFEAFGITDYDSVVFIDADTIIIQDISDLLEELPKKYDLAAVRDSNLQEFNTGVMIIGKKHLDENIVKNLIKLAIPGTSYNGDQSIINKLLSESFWGLPIWYNCLKTDYRHAGSWLSMAKILHFVAKKPWQRYDTSYHYPGNLECSYAESLWFKVKNTIPFLGDTHV